jgi:hypothetical protein
MPRRIIKKRPGSHAVPPVNTLVSAPNPYRGIAVNFVTLYGLESYVNKLREERGYGGQKLAKIINTTKGLLPEGVKISVMSVNRYLEKQGYIGEKARVKRDSVVDIYKFERNMLELLEESIDSIKDNIATLNSNAAEQEITDVKSMNALYSTLDRMILRADLMAEKIGGIQEKVYSFNAVVGIMKIIFDTIGEESPELKDKIMKKVQQNKMYAEAMKTIRK